MTKLAITGPTHLRGEWFTAGSKNAVLPMLATSLLTDEPLTLENVPQISDVDVMLNILASLGASVRREGHTVTIQANSLATATIPDELTAKMRASVLVLGSAVARLGKITAAQPGGDIIGARPLASHLKAFQAMGLTVERNRSHITISGQPQGGRIVLGELTVTGAENAIMAAVLASGTTELRMVALEPHVVELCNLLCQMGAQIEGVGTHNLIIHGVAKLHGAHFRVPPDQLESGTIAIAAAASRGDVVVHDFLRDEHDVLLTLFDQIGVEYRLPDDKTIHILSGGDYQAVSVRTQPYPNFPSDLQAPLAVLLTQCAGTSEIFETLYEGRLQYLFELQRMGAAVAIRDTHTGLITGPTPLAGADLISFDIRAGATILIAALIAQGTTMIDRIEHIDRGYERIEERLQALGATLERIE
ncbi:UDP-N-acetylglucosamine 1-carboxyvinyltransferase [bacterium]|nr:MAG: UDP-N-acetylglucosamine 1-carboxyvinyltransferase [bacterium]